MHEHLEAMLATLDPCSEQDHNLKQLFAALCLSTASYESYSSYLVKALHRRMRFAVKWRLCLQWEMMLTGVRRKKILGPFGECAHVLYLNDLVAVVVRGSNDPWDWIRNLQAELTPFTAMDDGGEPPDVHEGFLKCAEALREPLAKAIGQEKPVFWCGHSMGGAVAVLLAQMIAPDRSTVRTLGAPHWTAHPDRFQRCNPDLDVVNLINRQDPVPFVCQKGLRANEPLLPYQRMGTNHILYGDGDIAFDVDDADIKKLDGKRHTVFAHSCLAYHVKLVEIMEARALSTDWDHVSRYIKE